jgi:hypothetical protein
MMGKVLVPPKEIHTALDLECFYYREALLALDHDELNIAALHPKTRELVEMLRKEV